MIVRLQTMGIVGGIMSFDVVFRMLVCVAEFVGAMLMLLVCVNDHAMAMLMAVAVQVHMIVTMAVFVIGVHGASPLAGPCSRPSMPKGGAC